ncbi:MAG TPA: hypothetical protein VIH55_04405 [Acidimicrobiia bacterium]
MRRLRLATGILLLVAGTVWALQGLNVTYAPQSFMTGDRSWVVIGVGSIVLGGILVWTSRISD